MADKRKYLNGTYVCINEKMFFFNVSLYLIVCHLVEGLLFRVSVYDMLIGKQFSSNYEKSQSDTISKPPK